MQFCNIELWVNPPLTWVVAGSSPDDPQVGAPEAAVRLVAALGGEPPEILASLGVCPRWEVDSSTFG